MTAGPHADRDLHVFEIFRAAYFRVRAHEYGPWGIPVSVGNEPAHAGAGIANTAPGAGALNDVAPLHIGFVLRALEIRQVLPARLRSAEGLPVELNVEPFGGEE